MRSHLALALGLALITHSARGQKADSLKHTDAPPRVMRATRRTTPIVIDGRLDDAAWATAEPTGAFVQSCPQPGVTAPDQTQVRILYDDDALYVGIRLFDAHPDSIAAGLARRDAGASTGIYTDWVHLVIDSYHDRRTAFRFSTTPRGVQKDGYIFNDNNEDNNWDAPGQATPTFPSACIHQATSLTPIRRRERSGGRATRRCATALVRSVAGADVTGEFEREADAGSLYVGSPETVTKRIVATIIQLGPSRFDMKYSAGTLSHERLMRSIDLYASSLVPRARQLITAARESDPAQVFLR
jgi:hypothetical protein